jgi:phenylacetic acid degradation operon negative regulatory protein
MSDRTLAAAAALVARFRRQRPLRGGSLIITVFGDAIAPRGGAITLGSLIPLMQAFGLTERLVRTSVARLATDDWLASRRSGRLSEYRLSTPGRARFLDATRRIYAGPATAWTGNWTLVLMPGLDTPRRQQIREALRLEGFGEPGPGVLAHPTLTPRNAPQLAPHGLGDAPIIPRVARWRARRRPAPAAGGLGPARPGAALRALHRQLAPLLATLARRQQPPPPSAFIVRTLLIHEYRKIHLRDRCCRSHCCGRLAGNRRL